MPLNIQPQDRTKPEKLELELHPTLIARIKAYAQSLEGSDVNYVVGQILEQALLELDGGKNGTRRRKGNSAKHASKDTKK